MSSYPAETGPSSANGEASVIDISHLDQYTLGDKSLQTELLQLFRIQLKDQMNELMACEDADAWRSAAHMLKGASRAVGAWQISEIAEALEDISHDDTASRTALIGQLLSASAAFEQAVIAYI
jgi:HPt (histidine-containing phosphotransfer) domain-containing protein